MVVREKNVVITNNNQTIPLEFSDNTFKIFRKAFKKDFMNVVNLETDREEVNVTESTEHMLQIMWALAKTANPKTQRYEKWKKQFSLMTSFEILDLFEDVSNQLKNKAVEIWRNELYPQS